MGLYVQLSRAERLEGLYLFRKPARGDFIEPKNALGKDMRDALLDLEYLRDLTRERFKHDHRHERWFQEWDAMPEYTLTTDAADEEDGSLWCEAE